MAQEFERSPRILAISWGRMEVEDLEAGKNFKLYPGGGRARDWSETGNKHSPGVQIGDVEELLVNGATVIVLSRGMQLQLHVDPHTLDVRLFAAAGAHRESAHRMP